MLLSVATDASAQSATGNCQDTPVRVEIPGGKLDIALKQFRLVTGCPISGTQLARSKRSKPVVGTMEPAAALQAMLEGTDLQEERIKGGFQITRMPR